MHYKLIIFMLAIFAGFSCAQEGVIPPQAVLNAFQKLYPDVKDVEWEKEADNFEAEFYIDGDEISVEFNAKGKVLETEIEGKEDIEKDEDDQDSETDDNDTDDEDNDDDDE